MWKRGRLWLIAAGVALLALAAAMWLYPRVPEPAYQGKPLSFWLTALQVKGDLNGRSEEAAAVRAIGTNAIPTLLRMLRAHDSSRKTKLINLAENLPAVDIAGAQTINGRAAYGFSALGTNGVSAVPELIKILRENVSEHSVALTAQSLGWIGPPAKAAIPALLQAARDHITQRVHNGVFQALGLIHEDPEDVLPVLIQGLRDPFPWNHDTAAAALGRFGPRAKAAIPALVAALNDPAMQATDPQQFNRVQAQVKDAIRLIDPPTWYQVITNSPPGSGR